MRYLVHVLAAVSMLAATTAFAADYTLGKLEIEAPWTRATPPGAKAAGGFLIVTNTGGEADRLVSAEAGIAGRVELHTMSMTDGVMKMRHLPEGIDIPAGETVKLAPGGLHVMFMELKEPITQDAPVPVTLTFEKAGQVEVEMTVAPPGAPGPAGQGHKMGGGKN
ncbi:Nuclear export factor GLE1 [Nitratireductor indicus C115]|uniref:Nuclear export factor GLE1 n=1 Tax=Nitratireductor indicus C115 TaxID=1231190 RepID=K2P750_9HYPH|nr:copper chaperone PCu(A)C [Nitratireductor indicus]EKF43071.1 Nuclear export factor GLE1 [Nitratireductor indicus C115]SFQ52566.1 hypothetical protein SAMN05216176_105107 [Nitratireductor indicus]